MPGVYDVGRDFDADKFAETLKDAGVDYVTAFARCNLGFAYYPTKIGIIHPGLKNKNLLGAMVKACHKRNIQVAAYFNAGLDHEHALCHREWCKVNKEGQVYEFQKMGHFFRKMCLNSGYGQHLFSMVEEVLKKYPVDGIFLDCFNLSPCYGVECLGGMKKLRMDISNEQQVQEFCRIMTNEFAEKIKKLIKKTRTGINIYFNGLPYRQQPTHVEIECLPTGGWGYSFLPWAIRYVRTLNKPFFTMTGRFHGSWGDFCGLRPEHSLLFDGYNSIANGGTCSVGDHMHPRGRLDPAVYKLIGNVYSRIKKLEPWTDGAKPITEIAIISPFLREYPPVCPKGQFEGSLAGAARMLLELKCQFDVSDGETDLSKYRVIILPDDVLITGGLKRKLEKHLKNNGVIISSAFAGLDPAKKRFALEEYKIDFIWPEPYNISFFEADREFIRDIPMMLATIYEPAGIAMRPERGARVLARLYQPYFNKNSWDGYHENLYIPPERDSGRPALVRCGNIFHFSFPVFAAYFEHAMPAYRELVKNCLGSVFPEPLVKVGNFPSFGQVTVTQKAGNRMVHLLAYLPELRGRKMQVIEEPIVVKNVAAALRADGQRVRNVYLAPCEEKLEFQLEGKYLKVTVPEVNGYQMVVFEE
jgi:hypothetical protein